MSTVTGRKLTTWIQPTIVANVFSLSDASGLQGYVPMFVNATAGTTVYGAFDPINEIADICEKYNMWLHVDVREYQ